MKAASYTEFYQSPLTRHLLGDSFHPGGLKLTHSLAQRTQVNRNSKVLDVASGKCTSARYLVSQFGATVVALDLGVTNLQQAMTLSNEQQQKKLRCIVGDAQYLPVASESIDVVFCECALSTFDDREAVLTEFYRVLKPGGYIAISDIFVNNPLPGPLTSELSRWLCISGATNAIRCQQFVQRGGFTRVRFTDVSDQLLETVHTIETKLTAPDPALDELIHQNFDDEFAQFDWQHGTPRQLAQYIYDGGAGYYLMTACKPR